MNKNIRQFVTDKHQLVIVTSRSINSVVAAHADPTQSIRYVLGTIPGITSVKIMRSNELYLTRHHDYTWGGLKNQIYSGVNQYFA